MVICCEAADLCKAAVQSAAAAAETEATEGEVVQVKEVELGLEPGKIPQFSPPLGEPFWNEGDVDISWGCC